MIAMTAPHFSATEAGMNVLKNGGTAIEAMVAAAATIAVVYPHMNGLGGDGFWLISEPGQNPIAIDACGYAAENASPEFYHGLSSIPARGGKSALTLAGAVSGWQLALEKSASWQSLMPLDELLENAIFHARNGFTITQSQELAGKKVWNDFQDFKEFDVFRNGDRPYCKGDSLKLDKLADTLSHLAYHGLQDFYTGDIGHALARDLADSGSPIRHKDIQDYRAQMVEPLRAQISKGLLYNLPAPTQGIASLIILALYDRLQHQCSSESEHAHLFIECTKQAFIIRNQFLTDPSRLKQDLQTFLSDANLQRLQDKINLDEAAPWPHEAKLGDTIWMGACDNNGRMVSYIQSLFWEFGSGVVSPATGIVWNNRGTSFSLEENSVNYLQPGMKPFHTLNPAYAELNDGRRIVYGTMGGEGQPQTQGTLFYRHVYRHQTLADAIESPRWLLGRTWGDISHNLKIEDTMNDEIISALRNKGHDVATVPYLTEMMGHAGAISLSQHNISAATDPRSDGAAVSSNS